MSLIDFHEGWTSVGSWALSLQGLVSLKILGILSFFVYYVQYLGSLICYSVYFALKLHTIL